MYEAVEAFVNVKPIQEGHKMGVKKKYLFYYEDSVNAWVPVPDKVSEIFDFDSYKDGQEVELRLQFAEMTQEEFDAIPED